MAPHFASLPDGPDGPAVAAEVHDIPEATQRARLSRVARPAARPPRKVVVLVHHVRVSKGDINFGAAGNARIDSGSHPSVGAGGDFRLPQRALAESYGLWGFVTEKSVQGIERKPHRGGVPPETPRLNCRICHAPVLNRGTRGRRPVCCGPDVGAGAREYGIAGVVDAVSQPRQGPPRSSRRRASALAAMSGSRR